MDSALEKIRSTKISTSSVNMQGNNLTSSNPASTNQTTSGERFNKIKQKRSLHQQSFDKSDSNKIGAYAAAVMVRNEQPVSVPHLPQKTAANPQANSTPKLHFNYLEAEKPQTVIPPNRISEVEEEPDTSLHYLNQLNNKKQTVTSISFDSKANLSRKSFVQTSAKEISSSKTQSNNFGMREVVSILDPSAVQNMESVIIGRGPLRREY